MKTEDIQTYADFVQLAAELTAVAEKTNVPAIIKYSLEHGKMGEVAYIQGLISFAIQAKLNSELCNSGANMNDPAVTVAHIFDVVTQIITGTFKAHPKLQEYDIIDVLTRVMEISEPTANDNSTTATKH